MSFQTLPALGPCIYLLASRVTDSSVEGLGETALTCQKPLHWRVLQIFLKTRKESGGPYQSQTVEAGIWSLCRFSLFASAETRHRNNVWIVCKKAKEIQRTRRSAARQPEPHHWGGTVLSCCLLPLHFPEAHQNIINTKQIKKWTLPMPQGAWRLSRQHVDS